NLKTGILEHRYAEKSDALFSEDSWKVLRFDIEGRNRGFDIDLELNTCLDSFDLLFIDSVLECNLPRIKKIEGVRTAQVSEKVGLADPVVSADGHGRLPGGETTKQTSEKTEHFGFARITSETRQCGVRSFSSAACAGPPCDAQLAG